MRGGGTADGRVPSLQGGQIDRATDRKSPGRRQPSEARQEKGKDPDASIIAEVRGRFKR